MSPNLLPVLPERVAEFWHLVKSYIQRVADKMGDATPVNVLYEDLVQSKRQLWLVATNGTINAAILTQLNNDYGVLTGQITHAGSDDEGQIDWEDVSNQISEYFKLEGCEKMVIIGRKGWSKFLPDFDSSKVFYEKEL